MISQDGAFFFNSHPYAPLEWVLEKNLIDNNNVYNNCYSINIHKKLLSKIQKILIMDNFTEKEIFPNPYEMAKTIQRLSLRT